MPKNRTEWNSGIEATGGSATEFTLAKILDKPTITVSIQDKDIAQNERMYTINGLPGQWQKELFNIARKKKRNS